MPNITRWIGTILAALLLSQPKIIAQIQDDFFDGNFTQNPSWVGDTADFKITSSSAIPDEMKPALQLDAVDSDTSILILPNAILENTEWRFWVKLSFNTSANNFARVYLVSDQSDLKGPLNGYFIQIGGINDSLAFMRQQGNSLIKLFGSTLAYTGNTTNVLRIKVTHENSGLWKLFADVDGGSNYLLEGEGFDNNFTQTAYFGIFCKYTSSNATKFYWDDFYVNEIIIDTLPPLLNFVDIIPPGQLLIGFSEAVDLASSQMLNNYVVNQNVGNPISAVRDETEHSKVKLTFLNPFEPGINYTLNVSQIADLAGNILESDSHDFMISPMQEIPAFSVLINELMADVNPPPDSLPETDYLELYNTTSEAINLEQFTLQPKSSSNPIEFPAVIIEPDSFLIVVAPGDVTDFQAFGPVIGLSGFSLNNEGEVILRNAAGSLMHSVNYDESWYKDDTKKQGGWALEMIDPSQPCAGEINWQAAISSKHGTPGSRNSVDAMIYSNPTILQAITINDNSLLLSFNHWMDSVSLSNPLLYSVNDGIGMPSQAIVSDIAFDKVTLEFASNFEKNVVYQLTLLDSLSDCSERYIAAGAGISFVLPNQAEPFEIVFNEMMIDPDPPLGLPEFEFIELFNTSESYLEMKAWSLVVSSSSKAIPDLVIGPKEYIILTEAAAVNLLGLYGKAYGMSSLGLTNSGVSLKLINDAGSTMSAVTYDDTWYGDDVKAQGGWTLEQIDPYIPCSGKDNWTASIFSAGGTPGGLNSVDAENAVLPLIEKVIVSDSKLLDVYFSQIMDRISLLNLSAFEVDKGIGNPANITITDSTYQHIQLAFNDEFLTGIVYTLILETSITNCIGLEVLNGTEKTFGVAEAAVSQDVVINEILFNPAGAGVDFVEVYNRSLKIINLYELKLGAVKKDIFGQADTTYKNVSDEDILLFSGAYVLFTTDPDKVMEQYYTSNPDGFLRMGSFPSYSNESGMVVLANRWGRRLDVFEYNEDMQYPLLNSVEGVSLERINYDRPTGDLTNWHSASSEVGYATPAYQNSQFISTEESQDEVSLEPQIFSPNNDGRDDVLNIHYEFTVPGFTAIILIFDANGRQVRTLINHELLGSSGSFSWDGITDDNQKGSAGIYIIYFEAYDTNGTVKKYKKTAVLAF